MSVDKYLVNSDKKDVQNDKDLNLNSNNIESSVGDENLVAQEIRRSTNEYQKNVKKGSVLAWVLAIGSGLGLGCCLMMTMMGDADWYYNIMFAIVFIVSVSALKGGKKNG